MSVYATVHQSRSGFNLAPPKHWSHTYGFRVPTLFIGPHVPFGFVDHTIYDHTSILKSLCDRFNLDATRLGPRTPLSNSFWHLIKISPRDLLLWEQTHNIWTRYISKYWQDQYNLLNNHSTKFGQKDKHQYKHCQGLLKLPKHDPTHYSGTPYNWTKFEIDILSGITYTLYTAQILEKVLWLPENMIKKSWLKLMDVFHSVMQKNK